MKHAADGSVANQPARYRRRPRSISNIYYVALRLVGLTLLIAIAASYAKPTWAAKCLDLQDPGPEPAPSVPTERLASKLSSASGLLTEAQLATSLPTKWRPMRQDGQ